MKIKKEYSPVLESINNVGKKKTLKEEAELEVVATLPPADKVALEQHIADRKRGLERRAHPEAYPNVKEVIEATASANSRTRHYDVVDRKGVAAILREAKKSGETFKVGRSDKLGFKYFVDVYPIYGSKGALEFDDESTTTDEPLKETLKEKTKKEYINNKVVKKDKKETKTMNEGIEQDIKKYIEWCKEKGKESNDFNSLDQFMKETNKPVNEGLEYEDGCFYGIPGVHFIDNGNAQDPEVEYNGLLMNYWDLEDYLYIDFKEDCAEKGIPVTDEEFEKFVRQESDRVKEIIEELGYYEDDSLDYEMGDNKNELDESFSGKYSDDEVGDLAKTNEWTEIFVDDEDEDDDNIDNIIVQDDDTVSYDEEDDILNEAKYKQPFNDSPEFYDSMYQAYKLLKDRKNGYGAVFGTSKKGKFTPNVMVRDSQPALKDVVNSLKTRPNGVTDVTVHTIYKQDLPEVKNLLKSKGLLKEEKELKEDLIVGTRDLKDFKPSKEAEKLWNEIVEKGKLDDLQFILEEKFKSGDEEDTIIDINTLNDLLINQEDFIRETIDLDSPSINNETSDKDEVEEDEDDEPVYSDDPFDDEYDYEEEDEEENPLGEPTYVDEDEEEVEPVKESVEGEQFFKNTKIEPIKEDVNKEPTLKLPNEKEEIKECDNNSSFDEEIATKYIKDNFKENVGQPETCVKPQNVTQKALEDSKDEEEIVDIGDDELNEMLGAPKLDNKEQPTQETQVVQPTKPQPVVDNKQKEEENKENDNGELK